jgi:cell wall-associated NlpC family hydrolase
MTDRIRLALLFLVLVAFVAARAGGALGARARAHVSHATAVAREQARIVRFARRYLGVRYVYGGTSPASGFDCSGFTRFVYAHFGIALPHYSGAQFGMGRRVSERGLRPGDLVFFDGLGHVGLYIGGGRFIHAPHTGSRVSIDTLSNHGSYDGARRIV